MNELRDKIHANAKAKGFWDRPTEFGTRLMLVASELAEALDADRNGADRARLDEVEEHMGKEDDKFIIQFQRDVRGSIDEEIADAIIRLLDICGGYDVDIDRVVKLKMHYNSLRAHMHGKKY
jgi:NTP pyrophosphatase (non-canonical NTP hydrolase)